VSLTAICCKTLEHIITSNIRKHLSQNKILHDNQHGLRSRRFCETQLVISIQDLATCKSLADGNQIDIILLDFSKAFDKFPHQRLIHKLNYYGNRDKKLNWIANFLGNRQQKVLLNGIPQGTILDQPYFYYLLMTYPNM
jgi:hypothetical protein